MTIFGPKLEVSLYPPLTRQEMESLEDFKETKQYQTIIRLFSLYLAEQLKILGRNAHLNKEDLKYQAERYRGMKMTYAHIVSKMNKMSKPKSK